MKKLTALILALIMLLSCAVTAMADVDRSFFTSEAEEGWISIIYNSANTNAFISSGLGWSYLIFDHPNAHPDFGSGTEFDIILIDYFTADIQPVLRLWIRYFATEYLHIYAVSFEVDGVTYRFDNVGSPERIYIQEGVYRENPLIIFSEDQIDFIIALFDYMKKLNSTGNLADASIRLTLHGDKNVTVMLDENFLADFFVVANSFMEAGCRDYMDDYDGTKMTVIK